MATDEDTPEFAVFLPHGSKARRAPWIAHLEVDDRHGMVAVGLTFVARDRSWPGAPRQRIQPGHIIMDCDSTLNLALQLVGVVRRLREREGRP
jgi:hypothetical protein